MMRVGPEHTFADNFRTQSGSSGLILEVPHAGLQLGCRHLQTFFSPLDVKRAADFAVDKLCSFVWEQPRHSIIVAEQSRYIVDLNRDEYDVDPRALRASTHSLHSPRGVIWRNDLRGRPLPGMPLSRDVFESRMASFYRPYHEWLEQTRCRLLRNGPCLQLAMHSMPSQQKWGAMPDVVLGTCFGKSASAEVIELVSQILQDAGLEVVCDDPYPGGFATEVAGKPDCGHHALQIELSRALYMDERRVEVIPSALNELRAHLARLSDSVDGWLRTQSGQTTCVTDQHS